MSGKVIRAPEKLFEDMKAGSEREKRKVRQQVFKWLTAQKKRKGVIYVIPDPETGEDTMVSHPGIH